MNKFYTLLALLTISLSIFAIEKSTEGIQDNRTPFLGKVKSLVSLEHSTSRACDSILFMHFGESVYVNANY